MFAVFYILVSVILLSYGISILGSIQIERAAAQVRYKRLHQKLNFAILREFDTDGDGVDKYEFVIGMLKQLE
jgi:hypothetical protein